MFMVCFLTFIVTAVAFVVYWWKKRKARIAAGEDYQNDESYQSISLRKKIIGLVCVISFIGMPLTVPEMTPEEKAAYQAKREQEKIEENRRAEEKAKKEAEEQQLAAEKKAQEEAEQKRLAEEKAQKEAEQKRLAEEKKLKEEAEQKRIDEEKRIAEERANDPYYDYKDGDKGLTGYELWASTHLAKNVHDFSSERKKLPFLGNPTLEELAQLAKQKENRHLVRSRWNYIGNDSFTTYSPGADALVYFGEIEDEAPTGMGILAWYIAPVKGADGNYVDWLEPAYIGNFKDGRFHGYGILFAQSSNGFGTNKSPVKGEDGILYEGEFAKGEFDGDGILYATGFSSMRNYGKHKNNYQELADLAVKHGQKIGDKFYILSGEFSDNKFED